MANRREEQLERVSEIIERSYMLSSEVFESRARMYDLSLQQMVVLITIDQLGPGVPIIEISRASKTSPSTLTGITNRLVELGLIERERPPDNRRTVRVSTSDRGRDVVAEITEAQRMMLATALEGMLPEQVDQFIETFTALLDGFTEQLAELK